MSAPTGFLQFLIASLVNMANDPKNSKFFLPNFIKGLDGGNYVPLNTVFNIGPVPDLTEQASQQICLAAWLNTIPNDKLKEGETAIASSAPAIDITSIRIDGLNNAKVLDQADGGWVVDPVSSGRYPVRFKAALGAYDTTEVPGIMPFQVDGEGTEFTFSVGCCTTMDGKTCDGNQSAPLTTIGSFKASFDQPFFNLAMYLTFNEDLTVGVDVPESYTLAGGEETKGIFISFGSEGGIKVSDITFQAAEKFKKNWERFANIFFGSQEGSEQIAEAINHTINSHDTRNTVGEAIASQINKVIAELK